MKKKGITTSCEVMNSETTPKNFVDQNCILELHLHVRFSSLTTLIVSTPIDSKHTPFGDDW